MTIVVAVRFSKGVVVATDSRITYGDFPLMREDERKIDSLNQKIAVTSTGLTGACDRILKDIKASVGSSTFLTFDEVVKKSEDIVWDFYKRNKERIEEEEEKEETYWSVQLFSKDRIVNIGPTGFSEEEPSYLCNGSGKLYAEYILRQRYKPSLSEQECQELTAYVVLQTSRIDPSVGGPINITVLDDQRMRKVPRDKVDEIVENLTETSFEHAMKIQTLVNEIVEKRRWINDLLRHRFKSDLFKQNEVAVSEIQRGCKNEGDFTNRVAALALLVAGMEIPERVQDTDQTITGSVNRLEKFANKNLPKLNSECITILRDIMTLRSKKMPIHEDDPKIVQVLLKWEYKIPPNWENLWIKALSKYRDSLSLLMESLDTR
jgi:20S proteasome alpha/beta subunit